MASTFRCMGCEASEIAAETIPGHQKGGYVALVPLRQDEDEDDHGEPDPMMAFKSLEDE
jgi:hypothetical protein